MRRAHRLRPTPAADRGTTRRADVAALSMLTPAPGRDRGNLATSAGTLVAGTGAMALFDWRDDYSVKVPSIDAQHQQLVAILNQLHEGMTSGTGTERMSALLASLVDYTAKHFAYEEALFAEHGYPGTQAHVDEHKRLVTQVLEFKRKFELGEASINMQLMKFLKDWLIKHILGSDKAYSSHLVERGVK
jgi:hemerythrin-like metal-binding protein